MSKAEFANSKSVNLTDTDRLNIILKYMDYNARLSIINSFMYPDKAVHYRSTASALIAMYKMAKSDEQIMRMECELQAFEDSPVWEIELP